MRNLKIIILVISTALWIVLSLSGCGSNTPTAAAGGGTGGGITILMGGTIQGTQLGVSSNSAVSVFAGVPGWVTLANASYADGIGGAARFSQPQGMTTDGTNLYVADCNNHIIRKIVIATGQVTTIAGTASSAGSIDGTGTAAKFNWPVDITTDGTNLYVCDTNNNTIRKIVMATGQVTTLAGSASAIGATVNGTGTAAQFNMPLYITTDGTNLYVLENTADIIRKIVISTGVVTSITTTPAITPTTYNAITTDGTNLYTTIPGAIYKISPISGQTTLIAGSTGATLVTGNLDGTGTAARFWLPSGITTDGSNLYVTDINNNNIRKIVISTGVVTTLSVAAPASTWLWPRGITTNGLSLYVAQQDNNCISKIQ